MMRVVISSIQQNLKNKRIKNIYHVKSCDQIADVFTKSGVNTERILSAIQNGTLKIKQDQMSSDMFLKYCDKRSSDDHKVLNSVSRDGGQKQDRRSTDETN